MLIKRYPFFIILIICVICGLLLGAKSCASRSRKKTVSGSSTVYNTFTINPPSNLSATLISLWQIDLFWTDNSNNNDGFEIESSPDGNNYSVIATTNANTTSYSDTTVIPYSAYYYRVRALNTIGDRSAYSNIANIFTFNYSWVPTFSSIAAGRFCSIALATDSTVWVWGQNNGALGLGDWFGSFDYAPFPIQIESDYNWGVFNNIDNISITLNQYGYAFSRKTDGTLWAWGSNGSGQLGNGNDFTMIAPLQSNSDSDWSSFATGFSHSLAVKTDNSLWAWGQNDLSQLGFDTRATVFLPVGTQSDWSKISTGWYHTMCIKTNPAGGTLWGWGSNDRGQLGIGNTLYSSSIIQLNSDSDWSEVTAGTEHTIAIKSNGTIWGWGSNLLGTLGLGDTINRLVPSQAGSDSDWSGISVGTWYTLALKTNNTLWVCGYNNLGQLGLGDTVNRDTLTQINTQSDWAKIYSGQYHNVAVKIDGTIWSWGRNISGELGLGDTISRTAPAQVGIDSDWVKISAANDHTIGLKSTGTVWAWGKNNLGQLGLGNTIYRKTPAQIGVQTDWVDISVGYSHSTGIKSGSSRIIVDEEPLSTNGRILSFST